MKKLQDTVFDHMQQVLDAIAVIFDDGSQRCRISLTYREMWERSILVSKCLRENAIINEVVGICIQPAVNLPSVLLGILQSSCAFYPFGTDGQGFVKQALHLLSVQHIIVDFSTFETLQPWLFQLNCKPVHSPGLFSVGFHLVHVKWDGIHSAPLQFFPNLAYCITTSGTTGSPKIVRVPHSCIVPNIQDLRKEFMPSVGDVTFLGSPLTFDPSIVDIFVTLSSGAALLIVPHEVKVSPERLLTMLHVRHRVTILQITPTVLSRFDAETLKGTLLGAESYLRILVLGGEKFPSSYLFNQWCSPTNGTTVYNIYGITEVSCWASLHCARGPRGVFKEPVPIGRPLTGTKVKVVDEMGSDISHGTGHILIGSSERVCMLNSEGEDILTSGMLWRSTGDIGRVNDSRQIFCLGRTDRQIKRHGKRLNLETLEKVSRDVKEVELSCAIFSENQVHLFVASSNKGLESNKRMCDEVRIYLQQTLPCQYHPDTVTLVQAFPINAHGKLDMPALLSKEKGGYQGNSVHSSVENLLQSLWQETLITNKVVSPGDCFLMSGGDSLKAVQLADSVEKHFDCQIPQLLEIILTGTFIRFVTCVKNHISMQPNSSSEKRGIKRSHQSGRGVSELNAHLSESISKPDDKSTILEKKCSSKSNFAVVKKIKQEISNAESPRAVCKETCCPRHKCTQTNVISAQHSCTDSCDFPGLVDPLLLCKRCCATNRNDDVSSQQQMDVVEKTGSRHSTGMVGSFPEHSHNTDPQDLVMSLSRGGQLRWIHKRSCAVEMDFPKRMDQSSPQNETEEASATAHPSGGTSISQTRGCRVSLTLKWCVDTGKCVDASPVVGGRRNGEKVIFIGSHSHKLFAIDMARGHRKWCMKLGDRIEGSACISACGRWIIVGSYDHYIYILDVHTGKEWWKVQTKDVVKCMPVTDPLSGLVVCGSHDGYIYALCIKKRQVVWQNSAGGGSVFASPAIHFSTGTVCAATLSGRVTALVLVSGEQVWSMDLKKPVFSSPAVHEDYLYVGCVDGTLNCLSALSGQNMWAFRTKAPIFSSPMVTTQAGGKIQVLFGSHDNNLYCISRDGQLLWHHSTDAAVYATPFVFQLSGDASNESDKKAAGVVSQDIPASERQNEKNCSSLDKGQSSMQTNAGKNADVLTPEEDAKTDLSLPENIQNQRAKLSAPEGDSKAKDQTCSDPNTSSSCGEIAIHNYEHSVQIQGVKSSQKHCEGNSGSQLHGKCLQHTKLAEGEDGESLTVCAATSGNVFIVDTNTGAQLGHTRLPAEVFSSPVIVGNHLVVGCRDNFVYCYMMLCASRDHDISC